MAFVTGVSYDTTPGTYNGGFENLPRFHENWSGVNCYIRGSFVVLWESQYAKGKWVYGSDNYRAPRRKWSYDTDLNEVGNIPAFSPTVVGTRRVVWWEEGANPYIY